MPAAPADSVPESGSEPDSCAAATQLSKSIICVCQFLSDSAETARRSHWSCGSGSNRDEHWGMNWWLIFTEEKSGGAHTSSVEVLSAETAANYKGEKNVAHSKPWCKNCLYSTEIFFFFFCTMAMSVQHFFLLAGWSLIWILLCT